MAGVLISSLVPSNYENLQLKIPFSLAPLSTAASPVLNLIYHLQFDPKYRFAIKNLVPLLLQIIVYPEKRQKKGYHVVLVLLKI